MKNQLMQFLNKAKDIKMPKMPAMSGGTKKSTKTAEKEETKEESKSTTTPKQQD